MTGRSDDSDHSFPSIFIRKPSLPPGAHAELGELARAGARDGEEARARGDAVGRADEGVDRLHDEVQKALALPDVRAKLGAQGVEPMPLGPREIDAMIAKEIVQNIKLANAAGLKFN